MGAGSVPVSKRHASGERGRRWGRAVVAVAMGVVLVGCQAASGSPSRSIGPTGRSAPTATLEPTSSPTAQPTPSRWTGLDWSGGIFGIKDANGRASIEAIAPWRGGYVGAGSFTTKSGGYFSAFFASPDGLHWTKTYQGTDDWAATQDAAGLVPSRLLQVGSGLIAVSHSIVGAPSFWRSADGSTWTPVTSPVPEVMTGDTVIAMAAGPAGLLAIGAKGSMCCGNPQGLAVMARSSDGRSWQRVALPSAFERAYLRAVAVYASGFVVVGRVGEPDGSNGVPGSGRPAAWTSPDGLTWTAAQVDGAEATGAGLNKVIVGADGLFAVGRQLVTWTAVGPQGPLSGWASTDGRTWRLLGELGTALPDATAVAGDGTHLVMFGRDSCKISELMAWTSSDGTTWTQLPFSGSSSIPVIGGPICHDDGTESSDAGAVGVSYAVVMADGVVVVGVGGIPDQGFWFATATTP